MPLSKSVIQELIERPVQADGRVLSVYVNVDQSRAVNLNREYIAALKACLRTLESGLPEGGGERFRADAARIVQFVEGHPPAGRALAVFADSRSGFFRFFDLRVSVEDSARWEPRCWVMPLLEALDEFERVAVALVSRERARLFAVTIGEIEECVEIASDEERRRVRGTGHERLLSQGNAQRREDERAHAHYKEVAAEIERLAARKPFARLILAESAHEVEKLLSKALQQRVVGSVRLPIDSGDAQVLAEVARLGLEAERASEVAILNELLTAANKNGHAVLGWPPVLDALRQGRIRRLVYSNGACWTASQCANCESLIPGHTLECPFCGGRSAPLPDPVARVAEMVVHSGGDAENVRGEAADQLAGAGGIGALLRF